MKQTLIILGALLWLAGCAGGPQRERPPWLDGGDPRYPPAQYLTGVGSAGESDEAQDRARASLAKVFEARVEEESRDVQRAERRREGEALRELDEQAVSRALRVRTDVVLTGARIAEQWRDPETGMAYALAVLPRGQAAAGLRQEIRRLDEATEAVLRLGARSQDPFARAGALARALELQRDRDGYQRMLKVVDLSGRGLPAQWSPAGLELELGQALGGIAVAAEADSPQLASRLAGAVAAAGLKPAGAGAAYVLAGRLESQDLGRREGWHWLRGRLQVALRGPGGELRGSHAWGLKVAALDREAAEARLLEEAEKLLRRELREVLVGFATGASSP